MGLTATAAVGLALLLDAAFEEFPSRVHPVALFGRTVDRLDRSWSAPEAVGVAVAVGPPLAAAVVSGTSTAAAVGYGPLPGGVVAGLWLFGATSLRMLLSAAARVTELSASDPDAAREAVVALVGRDPSALGDEELRSAVLESAAENLADGLVAPLFAFALGAQASLAVGVAGAVWMKAVNTLDSMLGYRSKRVGRASARLDDAVVWLPARLSAVLIALAGRSPGSLRAARSWARTPASPNSGWPMATLAAVLGVRLVKPDRYVLNPEADPPTVADARVGLRVVRDAGVLTFVLAGVVAWL
jgi:adenosylcobinamide-phosphate synthase